jgi:pimeloyl-CoA dehydrogenase
MDFSLNDEHLALREAVQRFCDGEYPAQHRGNPLAPEILAQRWRGMAELGLLGLPFDEDVGGSAQGPVELMLVAQQFGRSLGGGAYVSSVVLAGQLLAGCANATQRRQWLQPLVRGELQMALAVHESAARYQWSDVQTTAMTDVAGFVLNGNKTMVLDGDAAELLLVLARTSGARRDHEGLSLLAVDSTAPGVTVQGFDTLDGRRAAHVAFKDVRVNASSLLGPRDQAHAAVDKALDAATAALCAEACGALQAMLELTIEHLNTRQQFGVPLARFQALQHCVADMAIALEQLNSMACAAAMAMHARDVRQRHRLVSAAKVLASQLGRQTGLMAIQLHGAMGMTDECRIGHYAKRLLVIGQLFGDSQFHLQRFAASGMP